MRRRVTGATAILAVLAFARAGCGGGEEEGGSPVTRRDSAGIEIVRSAAPAWTEEESWRVRPDPPVLDLGSASGSPDAELYEVRGLIRLSDGRWVVANGGTNRLLLYGPGGELLARAGGQGEGPGEFRRLSGLARLPGDSILAWDGPAPRLTVFTASGELARSFRLEDPPDDLGAGTDLSISRAFPVGAFGDGTLLARGIELPGGGRPATGVVTPTRAYFRYASDGTYRSLLATYPGATRWMRVGEASVEVRGVPFTATPGQAVRRDRWYFGGGDRYEIAVHDGSAGTPSVLIRREHVPGEITGADLDAYVASRLEEIEDRNARAELRRRLEEMPLPPTFPAYGDFVVGDGGHLWIHGYRRPGEAPPAWSVFAPDGRWLGDVRLPAGLEPMWIDGEVVAGVWTDGLDVEHVRAYRLVKP